MNGIYIQDNDGRHVGLVAYNERDNEALEVKITEAIAGDMCCSFSEVTLRDFKIESLLDAVRGKRELYTFEAESINDPDVYYYYEAEEGFIY